MGLYTDQVFRICSRMRNPAQIRAARRLRRDMTPAERQLWSILRSERFKPFHIRRQAPIDRWIADFLSHRARLVIEVDGDTHSAGRDARRDAALRQLGFETIRFFNSDIYLNVDGVADRIFAELSFRYDPHPIPPRKRGGDTVPPEFKEGAQH